MPAPHPDEKTRRAHMNGSGSKTPQAPAEGRIVRVATRRTPPIELRIDGEIVQAWSEDTVLLAVLSHRTALRTHEFDGQPRAGFCLMGACQDCWLWREDGSRLRACTTPVEPGLALLTRPPVDRFGHA
jgi:D-hydroxyproline dehydrogenase subunit gamma